MTLTRTTQLTRFTMAKLHIVELEAHKTPEFKEQKNKDWVLYGTDGEWKNRYPDYLLNLYHRSAKHNAIINGKVDYIVGNGVKVNDKGLDTIGLAKLMKFVDEPNPNETLEELVYKAALDVELFGGFALEVVYDKKGRFAEIYHAEFRKYRASKDGDRYFYCDDWKKARESDIEEIPAFNWANPSGKQLLYVKTYDPKADYYPLPQYIGAIPYVEIDYEIANFHLNSIKNGFAGGTVFEFFNGQPTEEEQEELEAKIHAKYAGTDNANRVLLIFNDSQEQATKITPLSSNDLDTRFDILNKTVQQEIFSGHRIVDPSLFGIKEEGIFASRNQVRDSYELFKNTYVNQRQRFIMRIFNELAALQGFEKRLDIADSEPISEGYSEATKVSVMTTDEIRAELGLVVEEKTDAVDSKEKDAQSALKGSVGGVTGVITVLQNVKTGLIAENSAIELLINLYGFDKLTATAIVTGRTVEPVAQQMRNVLDEDFQEHRITEAFSNCGLSLDEYEVVKPVRQVRFNSDAEMIASEKMIEQFGTDNPFTMAVLNAFKENPQVTYAEIAASLQSSVDSVFKAVQELARGGMLKLSVGDVLDSSQRIAEVTKQGEKALKDVKPLEASFKIAYRYVKSAEATGDELIPTSRPFCVKMVGQSKSRVWTQKDIQDIGMREDRNVWLRRGGFWTRKGTDITTAYCRHAWEQVIVKKK